MFWRLLNQFARKNYLNDTVYNVKYYLKLQKYNSLQFFALPNDKSQGSRELLIALAFLIAKDELNNIVYEEVNQSPFQNERNSKESFTLKNGNLEYNYRNQCKTATDSENLVKWLKGRIAYNKKLTQEYKSCSEKMVKKVNVIGLFLKVNFVKCRYCS